MSASITQRVCRWCSAPLVKSNQAWTDNEGAILCRNQNFPFHEPVAEPASTGEPGPGFYRSASLQESIAQDEVERAARPSEPSAPPCDCSAGKNARLYEHHRDCHWLQFVTRPENNPAAPQTSAEHLKKCVKEGPDCDCVTVCKFAAAPQSVSGDAPEFPFNWPVLPTRKRLNPDECGHANITRTVIFEYIDGPNHNGWMCQDCGTEFIPKQAGDAPKVEEIILRAVDKCNPSTDGERFCLYSIIETAINEARPYFPPASQTPEIEVFPEWWLKEWDDALASAQEYERDAANANPESGYAPQQTMTDEEIQVAQEATSTANVRRMIAEIRRLRAATPASTARPDGPNFATNETEQRQIDIINLRLYARLAEDNEWKDDVLHWSVFQQTLEAIATRLERLPLPAAPGSVPQAHKCVCDEVKQFILARTTTDKYWVCPTHGHQHFEPPDLIGIPQAEPPKEEK